MHCNPQRNYTHNIEFHLPFLVIIVIFYIYNHKMREKNEVDGRKKKHREHVFVMLNFTYIILYLIIYTVVIYNIISHIIAE